MTEFEDNDGLQTRNLGPRLGIVALNLLAPGLGLWRLNRKALAAVIIILSLATVKLLMVRYAYGPTFTFASWSLTAGSVIVAILALYGASFVLSWRKSRYLEARSGWAWRWYGVALVWLITIILSPSIEAARSYYRTYSIPSESMLPVLRVGDLLMAQMHFATLLQRGDLVIVHKSGVDYIKRIVAVPGDKVAMVAGQIVLGGQPIEQRKVAMTPMSYDGAMKTATVYEEQLPGEAAPHQIIDILQTPQDDWAGATLGPDQYVVLGDNRDNALDSRFPEFAGGLGIVAREQIIGKALFRFWRKGAGIADGAL